MSGDTRQQASTRVERRDGRLHSIQEVRDKAGQVVSQLATPLKVELRAVLIAFPASFAATAVDYIK